MPPLPGVFLSGVEKIALAFWKAIGTFSMTAKNWRLASSENPSTSFVTLRRSSGRGVRALAVTESRINARVRLSISGTDRNIFARSSGSVT